MNRKTIGLIRQCIGCEVFHHVAQETSAYELWIKLEEMYQAKTSRNKALLMRRLVNLKLQRETIVAEHTSEFQNLEGHIKRNCPKYKAQNQSLDTAATTVMAVDKDEFDVLLAASEDGKSDWVLDSGSAYHLCRDREVFATYIPCEGRIWMANNTSSKVINRGSVRFRMADKRSVTLTEGELLSDMGPVVLARRMDKGSNRCTEVCKSSTGVFGGSVIVPRGYGADVHREAQRKETKSILRSCTTKDAATPKRVSFALDLISGGVLSNCAHKGGEMELR
ncbi:hypothetical protein Acr_28g0015390 [Actinidia rufa]|uniref:Retrovirus-related Pol polyprotein from transposon TNT 1-94-like beta-barrel domain-containing protein n=1 Tax=Actinidia rufa TaxID=165716 RepID=A0A7J0HDP5_9ERIC|nr:hypothetical protein Acr_28g0015390 [Actinidia rufa]